MVLNERDVFMLVLVSADFYKLQFIIQTFLGR